MIYDTYNQVVIVPGMILDDYVCSIAGSGAVALNTLSSSYIELVAHESLEVH